MRQVAVTTATGPAGVDAGLLLDAIGDNLSLLRHDSCGAHSLEPSLAFAKWEQRRGIRSVYFIWHDLPNYATPKFMDDVKRIRGAGHGIGIHFDAVPAWLSRGVPPAETFGRALDALRKTGEVTMAAGHGNPTAYSIDYRPYEIFVECDPTENEAPGNLDAWGVPKISTEAYGVVEVYLHGTHNVAVSDSRGIWNGWRDLVPRPFERIADNKGLSVLDDLKPDDKVSALLHPVYYRINP